VADTTLVGILEVERNAIGAFHSLRQWEKASWNESVKPFLDWLKGVAMTKRVAETFEPLSKELNLLKGQIKGLSETGGKVGPQFTKSVDEISRHYSDYITAYTEADPTAKARLLPLMQASYKSVAETVARLNPELDPQSGKFAEKVCSQLELIHNSFL